MFTMGMSFLLASLAFVARLAILVLLLGFSPVWFAAMIFPALKDKAKEFTAHLYGQLVFMPVYLLLLYGAMTVLTKTTVFSNPSGNVFTGTNGTFVPVNLIVLAINDFFILFLLNLPLATAFAFVTKDGAGMSWMKGMVDKAGAHNVWKNVGSFTGRNTLGKVAYSAGNSSFARSLNRLDPRVGRVVSGGLSKVSSAGFGGGKNAGFNQVRKTKLEDYKKLADKSNYTEEQAQRIANDRGLITGDVELRVAEKELVDTQNDYARLGAELAAATTPADQERIKNEMDKAQLKINNQTDKVENRKKAIIKGIKESPKEKMAQDFEAHRSVGQRLARGATLGRAGKKPSELNKAIADAIRKEKKPTDEIMDAIKGMGTAGGGGTGSGAGGARTP
jgi:uncharacterized protein YdbL (DUF1318 family)